MSDKDKEGLSHIREDGSATMVDVSDKAVVRREAIARGTIKLKSSTVRAISDGNTPKGDVLAVARVAGIQAAKKTPELIPLCHQLPLTKVEVNFDVNENGIEISALVRTDARTGVEMEALTAASVAALTIYDMCKAIDKEMVIGDVYLLNKRKEKI